MHSTATVDLRATLFKVLIIKVAELCRTELRLFCDYTIMHQKRFNTMSVLQKNIAVLIIFWYISHTIPDNQLMEQ